MDRELASMTSDFLKTYCDRYAEPIAAIFTSQHAALLPRRYQHVICIPAYDEPPNFIAPLLNTINADVLVILVLNAPQGEQYLPQQQRTQTALRSLTHHSEQLDLVSWNHKVDVLVVDCCTEGRQLPPREGVGLARKIAGDLAVAAIVHHKIESPWIYCTDADVQLPSTYFSAVPSELSKGYAAILYPFVHQPLHDNILQYEISLRFYVLQLAQAGSPYAFQTVGSSMAAHVQQYVAVRGFPKRNAAEDFYVLNKLAKTGAIIRLKTQPIVLSSRRSHRVPFGTGAAMNRLADDPIQRLYHPEIFVYLHQWIEQMARLWNERDRVQSQGLETWWRSSSITCDAILPVLTQQGLPKVLKQAYRQCRDRSHFLFYLHVWFDAFRTLRFIHLMRDCGFSSFPIAELPPHAFNLQTKPINLAQINQQLSVQELALPAIVGPTQATLAPETTFNRIHSS